MSTEKSKVVKKGKKSYYKAFILFSFPAFFLFNLLSFRTDSMNRYAEDYYTHSITGDMVILHQGGAIPGLFDIHHSFKDDGKALLKEEYSFIKKHLAENSEITSFTPFSLYPVTCMNKNKGKIQMWLKTIEPQSFSKVFPEVEFTHSDGSPLDTPHGILLPRALVHEIEDLLKTQLTEGDSFFINNKNTRISSIREIVFSGIVSPPGHYSALPRIAYTDMSSFPFKEADDTTMDRDVIEGKISINLPGEDEFYRDVITREPSIQKALLPDSYFFEFFQYKRRTHGENARIRGWQYIALSAGDKSRSEEIKNNLNHYFHMNHCPVTVISWKDAAGSILTSIFSNRLFNYCITLFLLLLLFIFSLYVYRNYAQLLKGKGPKISTGLYTDPFILLQQIKETTIGLYISLCISAGAGIFTSIITVQILNAFRLSPGNKWNTIFPGNKGFLISLSPGPFFASLLIVAILLATMSIYPLFLLATRKQSGTKEEM